MHVQVQARGHTLLPEHAVIILHVVVAEQVIHLRAAGAVIGKAA